MIYLGRDPETGKKQYKWTTFRGAKKEAQRALRELVRKYEEAEWVKPSSTTVAQYLERWLRDHVEMHLRDTTAARYRWLVEAYLLPQIGGERLQGLTPARIQKAYTDLLGSPGRNGQPLDKRMVAEVHTALRAALNRGVKWGLLVANPIQGVESPRVRRPEMRFWTQEQAAAFLAAAHGNPFFAAFWLALSCGMRRGEIAGLKWSDIDWERGRISLQRARVPVPKARPRTDDVKTGTSRRLVEVGPETLRVLRRHRARQAEVKLRHPEYADEGWIFADPHGRPCHPDSQAAAFRRLLKKSDLPRIRYHDLRHTCASLMLQAGDNPKVVSERLGHRSVQMTLDRYSHVAPGIQREAARRLESVLAGEDSPPED